MAGRRMHGRAAALLAVARPGHGSTAHQAHDRAYPQRDGIVRRDGDRAVLHRSPHGRKRRSGARGHGGRCQSNDGAPVTDVTVIADDLTGAADCGIAFALAGLPTFVSIGNAPAPDSAQIVSVDTDTRRLATGEAARRAGEAARDAYRRGTRGLYKKIDSTFRGHVAAELRATVQAAAELQGGDSPIVVFAPAFPGTGRTTRGGRVLVGGVPLEETEVWRKSG